MGSPELSIDSITLDFDGERQEPWASARGKISTFPDELQGSFETALSEEEMVTLNELVKDVIERVQKNLGSGS